MISWGDFYRREKHGEIPELRCPRGSASVVSFFPGICRGDYRLPPAILPGDRPVTFLRARGIAIGTASRSNRQMSGDTHVTSSRLSLELRSGMKRRRTRSPNVVGIQRPGCCGSVKVQPRCSARVR